jgi:hypothetical protein
MADDAGDDAPPEVELTPAELNAGLLAASKVGKRALALRALRLGADVRHADGKGWTPLLYASYYGHHRVVDALLAHGAAAPYKEAVEALAADPLGPRVHCVNSPLGWAVLRGHLRTAWLLLQAGFSPMDVDTNGNTSLHLAAACVAPDRAVQLEMLRTVMCAGCDPEARNWVGQRPVEMLAQPTPLTAGAAAAGATAAGGAASAHPPSSSTSAAAAGVDAARHLLSQASATTKCASSGTPFGADQLRFLCASSGKFFCEEASVAQNVNAYAPALKGVTVDDEAEEEAGAGSVRGGATSFAARYGIRHGIAGLPIAAARHDLAVTRPVRFGADISYRVTDAEGALETALAPYQEEVRRAYEAVGLKAPGTGAAAAPTPAPTAAAPAPAAAEGAPEAADEGDAAAAPAAPRPPSPAPPSLEVELELYLSQDAINALEAAITHARDLRGDVQLVARGMQTLRRLRAASGLRAAVVAAEKRRPVDGPGAADALADAIDAAKAAGVGPTLVAQAKLSLRVLYAEAAVVGASSVCGSIPVGTHAYDADIGRLGAAVAEAEAASAEALRVEGGGDVLEDPSAAISAHAGGSGDGVAAGSRPGSGATKSGEGGDGAGGQGADGEAAAAAVGEPGAEGGAASSADPAPDGGAAASGDPADAGDGAGGDGADPDGGEASSAEGGDGGDNGGSAAPAASRPPSAPKVQRKPKLDLPIPAENAIHLTPVAGAVLSDATALLSRLRGEVGITDSVNAATAAEAAVTAAAEAHKEEDPTLLPTPELPPGPVDANGVPIPPAAPAPAPVGPDGEPLPPPPPDPAFPCDTKGVPLPDTPQLLALKALRDRSADLEAVIATSTAAGADPACVAKATASLGALRAGLLASLTAEATRVEFYRAERAKLEKKNKKKKK